MLNLLELIFDIRLTLRWAGFLAASVVEENSKNFHLRVIWNNGIKELQNNFKEHRSAQVSVLRMAKKTDWGEGDEERATP